MFENWQGINPRGLSATLYYYKNKQFFNTPQPHMIDGRDGAHGYVPKRGFKRKKQAIWRGARRLWNIMTWINCKKKVFRLEMKTLDTHIAYNPVVCLYIHKHETITNYLKMKHKKIHKRITQWGPMPLGPTILFETETIIKNMTKKQLNLC